MPKKMLIDATHSEETRVVVVDGNKVEEFDFESLNKRQLSGNIYLAKITRVEPSLQAAFVDYGGNRHGFLAFSEIHPDYYQIPVADREALLAEQEAEEQAMRAAEDEDAKPKRSRSRSRSRSQAARDGAPQDETTTAELPPNETAEPVEKPVDGDGDIAAIADAVTDPSADVTAPVDAAINEMTPGAATGVGLPEEAARGGVQEPMLEGDGPDVTSGLGEAADLVDTPEGDTPTVRDTDDLTADPADADADADPEDAGDDGSDEAEVEQVRRDNRRRPKPRRYKIQEVVKVRQIMLVQVVKEERGNKGAALTTYLSLAGRYCVLMPNTARGGGISRKITNATDRKKLKEIAGEIEVPKGAGLIIRTAGAKRTRTEIKRDYEYLIRQWEQIRDLTMKSIAPTPIYEEGSLIKRSIRDLYSRDIDEVHVEGGAGYREAKDYMRMLMPSHAKNVKLYQDPVSLFGRYQVESYLGQMFNPTVQLKSGGYIVIGVTEALVAVDVNSGRSTKEGSIEDTALKTNLEAADEVARQLRLRDLAGLIVIDFIDMDERKNNAAVEKRMKDALKNDRARIQVGRISSFGLMEMSRQRLRPGMLEASTQPCPHCHGTGLVRSNDSLGLSIIRELEEEGVRQRCKEIVLTAPVDVANYLLNVKREHIAMIEQRYGIAIQINGDPHLISPEYKMERFKTASRTVIADPNAGVIQVDGLDLDAIQDAQAAEEAEEDDRVDAVAESEGEDDQPKKKKRRRSRRRGGRGRNGNGNDAENGEDNGDDDSRAEADDAKGGTRSGGGSQGGSGDGGDDAEDKPKSRSRSRSRSRKKSEDTDGDASPADAAVTASTETDGVATDSAEAQTPPTAPVADAPAEDKPKSRSRRKPETELAPEDEVVEGGEVAAEMSREAPLDAVISEETPGAAVDAIPDAQPEVPSGPAAEVMPGMTEPEEVATAPEEPAAEETPADPKTEEPVSASDETVGETTDEAEDDKPKKRGWWARTIGG
ncbi:Rne/Rng family ribonuclease [Roseobacter sp. HKCCA0434]|uniref:Rne/Rng family ribonuclease n=1 Tax=Roseobacter sp. HKCCA0434 TaxID=3079297 RepID=UPI0029059912|nr:Rne/Rng family ribonuclease [Roseobacter sp. HKCCA0434]